MPARVFTTGSAPTWTPSNDGITDGTAIRVHAIGCSGSGAGGDTFNPGSGGGGGERSASDHTVTTASDVYSVSVGAAAGEQQTYLEDATPAYVARAVYGGNAIGVLEGTGGTGGTGNLYTRAGGNGGVADATTGGGGGGGGNDAAAGSVGAAGSAGGAGGQSGTQLGQSNSTRGDGGDGVASGNGVAGNAWGGGGGGGSLTGSGGAAADGIVVVCWGAMLGGYPDDFADGFKEDPAESSGAWFLLLGS